MVKGFPSDIRISENVIYEVVWKKGLIDPASNAPAYGLCDLDSKIIYLTMGMDKITAMQTLVHEIMHALEEEWGMDLPHEIIETLEHPVVLVFILNNWWG